MSQGAASPYCAPTTREVVAGAIYLHVPITFYPPARVPAVAPVARGLLQVNPDFAQAYNDAPKTLRDNGIPVSVFAKPRPVLVLRVGRIEPDRTHAANVWVAPRYGVHEREKAGRNLFPLPAERRVGLDEDGYLDFFQLATLPTALLRTYRRGGDVTPATFNAVVMALRAFLDPWEPPAR